VITLTNVGTGYDTIQAARGLGIGRRDFRGYDRLTFDVSHNKVGTGTITYQVYDETGGGPLLDAGGAEILVTDAAAAGARLLTATFTVNRSDTRLLRVRAKSTVAGDDPIYLGASVLLWKA
jgi:hypothetical protein